MYIGYSGAGSTGKSVDVYRRAAEEKINNPTKTVTIVSEVVRDCPLPVNESGTRYSQLWIFTEHIRREVEAVHDYDIVVADRTAVDNIAYAKLQGYDDLAEALLGVVRLWIPNYDIVIFKSIENNNYCYDDGFRSVSYNFRYGMEEVLVGLYKELGMWDRIVKL
jgi:hypothetical protein